MHSGHVGFSGFDRVVDTMKDHSFFLDKPYQILPFPRREDDVSPLFCFTLKLDPFLALTDT